MSQIIDSELSGEKKFLDFLLKEQILTSEKINYLLKNAEILRTSPLELAIQAGYINEIKITDLISEKLGFSKVLLATKSIELELGKYVPLKFANTFNCVPIGLNKKTLTIAIFNPFHQITIELEKTTGLSVRIEIATKTEIIDAIARLYSYDSFLKSYLKNIDVDNKLEFINFSMGNTVLEQDEIKEETKKEDLINIEIGYEETPPVIKMVNLILAQGIKEKSSDIHVEATSNFLIVRNRVDGVLHEMIRLPKWIQNGLISRFKILGNMDISEKRVPQDGNARIIFEDKTIELRFSTLPTYHGEKIVLRIIDKTTKKYNIDSLGFSEKDIVLLKASISQPQGLILVTGPTGCGKSSTLTACLEEINSTNINIITVENPIESQIQGVNQVQINVKVGLTFAKTLRAILRQDPNVIMVGEIRDHETAEIALNASMTGHLVLSTLHTNDSVSTITRLIDLDIPPFLIASSLLLIVAQRLVRKNCQNCLVEYSPEDFILTKLNISKNSLVFRRGQGCNDCKYNGYNGRIGIYEVLNIDKTLRELIIKKATESQISKAAKANGVNFLLDDAIEKVKNGLTNIEEVIRVIQYEREVTVLCSTCNSKIKPDFVLCPFCFTNISNDCPSCKKEIESQWVICPYCRYDLGEDKHNIRKISDTYKPLVKVTEPIKLLEEKKNIGGIIHKHIYNLEQIHILLVDDDVFTLKIYSNTLSKLRVSHTLVTATNGKEALQKVEEKTPNLVITDVNMPEMDGFELCENLKKNLKTTFIPIIMITARSDEKDQAKGFLVGTDDYILKPIKPNELLFRVEKALIRTYGLNIE